MTALLSPNGPTVTHLSGAPTRLLVGTLDGVAGLERAAGSDAWMATPARLQGSHISALAAVPGGFVAGAHSGGAFFSPDGISWVARNRGLSVDHVFCLNTQTIQDRVRLFAGTQPVSLFVSDDEGENWRELPSIGKVPGAEKWTFPPPPHHAHTKSLTFVPGRPDLIYACIEQGALLRSDDGGQSWRELDSYYDPQDRWYRDIHRLVIWPSDPDRLLMATGMGLYLSGDAGETWDKVTGFDCRVGYPDQIILAPDDENLVFLSGSREDPSAWRTSHAANGTVLVSRDRGRSWSESASGLPASGRANIEAMNMAVWPGGFTLFVGNTDGEIYCSEDRALSWRLIGSGFRPVSKVGHYRHLQSA